MRKKAHADDKLCNYSGSIFALLACSQELQWLIKQSKETPLTEACIPRFSLIQEGDCLVLHSLMPSHLARAVTNQQVHKLISKAVKTSFWNQILKQCSTAAFSSRARLLSASLGIFLFCAPTIRVDVFSDPLDQDHSGKVLHMIWCFTEAGGMSAVFAGGRTVKVHC